MSEYPEQRERRALACNRVTYGMEKLFRYVLCGLIYPGRGRSDEQ